MKFPKSELWDYSTQTYRLPGVEKACLKLQDSVGADVNVILYCCWLGDKRQLLKDQDLITLARSPSPWQNAILKPLRNARRMMKQHIIAMPAELLDQTISNMTEMEINAERMEQQSLEKAIDLTQRPIQQDRTPVDISAANLALYFQQLEGVTSLNDVSADLTGLLDAIYQDAEAIQIALMSAAS